VVVITTMKIEILSLKDDGSLQMGSGDPCPVYIFHMSDSDEFWATSVSSSSDRRYNFQGHRLLQWGSFPTLSLVVCRHNEMLKG
jgi:hypothetical protein